MMDGAHPDELDLLAYVEDELPDPRKAAVAEHVAACRACADSVRQLDAARHVLRSAPLLELPEKRRAAVMAGLPARKPARRLRRRPRLLAPALATAAVAAVIAGVVLTGDGNRAEDEAAQATAVREAEGGEEAAPATAPPPAPAAGDTRALSADAVRSVAGPPAEVARLLRRQGFDARVVDSAVEVPGADREAVRRALVGRPAGPVPVIVP